MSGTTGAIPSRMTDGNEPTTLNGWVYDPSGAQLFFQNGQPVATPPVRDNLINLVDRVSFEVLGTSISDPNIVRNAIFQAIRQYERQRFYFNEFRCAPVYYVTPGSGPGAGGAVGGGDDWSSVSTGWGGTGQGSGTIEIGSVYAIVGRLDTAIGFRQQPPVSASFGVSMPEPAVAIQAGGYGHATIVVTMPMPSVAIGMAQYVPIAPSGSAVAATQKFVMNPIKVSMKATS